MWFFNRRNNVVNCWFCNNDSTIDSCNKSWWYCYHCEQYNGFKEDGDYQHSISSMYNQLPFAQHFIQNEGSTPAMNCKNLLCSICHVNQNKKVYEMALFEPTSEDRFDVECEEYETYLEEKYKPCLSCRMLINSHLKEQDKQLKNTYIHEMAQGNTPMRKLTTQKLTVTSNTRLTIEKQLLHLLSLNGAYWFANHVNEKMNSNMDVLLPTFSVLVIMLTMSWLCKKNMNISLLMTSLLWISLLFCSSGFTICSYNGQWLILHLIFGFEVCGLVYTLARYIQEYKNKYMHTQERQRKVRLLRSTPLRRKNFDDSPHTTNQQTDSFNAAQATISNPSKSQQQLTNTIITSHKQSFVNENHFVSKGYVENNEFQKRNLEESCLVSRDSVPVHHSVTPDLLEGHLDAMFIEKKMNDMLKENRYHGNEKNHVIAALKYATPNQFLSGGPLLKPATLTLMSELPSTFVSEQPVKEVTKVDIRKNIVDKPAESQQAPCENTVKENLMDPDDDRVHQNIASLKNFLCHSPIVIIAFLSMSLLCNVYLVLSR